MQAERLGGGKVPPELVLLAHDEGESAAVSVVAFPGNKAEHAGCAGRRIDHAGEELECGGFSGAVGAEKGDEFALLDIQIDSADSFDLAILAVEEPTHGGREAFLL